MESGGVFHPPAPIDQEADAAPPAPNLAEVCPCQPRGAWQSPALGSDRFLPARKGFSLSCFLSSMATRLLPPFHTAPMQHKRGQSCFPRCSRHHPSPGASCRAGAAVGKGSVGWEGAGVGERSIPRLPPRHPPPHPPLPELGMGSSIPLGWFQLWSPQGLLGGGGGMAGTDTCFPQHPQLCGSRLWVPGGIPAAGGVPLSIPGWSCCVGPRGAWRAGGHTGPICFQLLDRVRRGSQAALPPANLGLGGRRVPAPGQPAGVFAVLNLNRGVFFKKLLEGLWDAVSNIFGVFTRQHGFCLPKKIERIRGWFLLLLFCTRESLPEGSGS